MALMVIAWSAIANASGYVVEYATNNSFTNAQSILTTGTSTTLTGLAANTLYYVRVAATGTGAYTDSDWSDTASFKTDAIRLAPPTLGNVTATGSDRISLSWNALPNASGYVIQYSTDSSFSTDIITLPGISASRTEATITGLNDETTYYFRIMAIGTGSYSNSDYSAVESATTDPKLSPAGSLDAFWSEYGLSGINDELAMPV